MTYVQSHRIVSTVSSKRSYLAGLAGVKVSSRKAASRRGGRNLSRQNRLETSGRFGARPGRRDLPAVESALKCTAVASGWAAVSRTSARRTISARGNIYHRIIFKQGVGKSGSEPRRDVQEWRRHRSPQLVPCRAASRLRPGGWSWFNLTRGLRGLSNIAVMFSHFCCWVHKTIARGGLCDVRMRRVFDDELIRFEGAHA
jgi:hypothetical protein